MPIRRVDDTFSGFFGAEGLSAFSVCKNKDREIETRGGKVTGRRKKQGR